MNCVATCLFALWSGAQHIARALPLGRLHARAMPAHLPLVPLSVRWHASVAFLIYNGCSQIGDHISDM